MKKIAFTITATAILGFSTIVGSASAETVKNLETKKQEINSERSSVKSNLTDSEKEVTTVLYGLKDLDSNIERTSEALKSNKTTLSEVKDTIKVNEKAIKKLENSISDLENNIEDRFELLKKRLVSYQKTGGDIAFLDVLAGAQNFDDFVTRAKAVKSISDSDIKLMGALESDQNQVEKEKKTVNKKLVSTKAKKTELESVTKTIKVQKKQQEKDKKELLTKQTELEELQETLQMKDSELASLESQVAADIDNAQAPPVVEVAAVETESEESTTTKAETSEKPEVEKEPKETSEEPEVEEEPEIEAETESTTTTESAEVEAETEATQERATESTTTINDRAQNEEPKATTYNTSRTETTSKVTTNDTSRAETTSKVTTNNASKPETTSRSTTNDTSRAETTPRLTTNNASRTETTPRSTTNNASRTETTPRSTTNNASKPETTSRTNNASRTETTPKATTNKPKTKSVKKATTKTKKVTTPAPSGNIGAVLNAGNPYLNGKSTYKFGGGRNQSDRDKGLFDCSGFVSYAYSKAGVSLPAQTGSLVSKGSPVSSLGQAKPGDLVFFSGNSHVGIYLGNGKFVGSQSSTGIAIESMTGSSYWAGQFNGVIRRVN